MAQLNDGGDSGFHFFVVWRFLNGRIAKREWKNMWLTKRQGEEWVSQNFLERNKNREMFDISLHLFLLFYNIGSQATLIFKTCGRKVTPEWSEKSFKNGKFWVPLFSLMTGYLLGSGKKWNDLSLLPSSSSHCWSWKIDETLLLLAEHRRQGLSWWWLWGAGMASHPHFLWDTRKCSRKSTGAVASMHVVY